MSVISDQFAATRREVLARLQNLQGLERQREKARRSDDEPIDIPFLELSDEDLDLALRVPTPSHLSDLKSTLRAMRSERFQELEEPARRDPEATPPVSKRRQLLAEIASEHFRTGMGSWLTSISPDHGLTSTPVDELVKLQGEMQYRMKLLRTIETMMQREIDALETQIKARRHLDAAPKEN